MKSIRYSADAARSLKRHGNIADRLRKSLRDYAADPAAHKNNVVALQGSAALRMRVGAYRIIFEETANELIITKIGPRGSIYD